VGSWVGGDLRGVQLSGVGNVVAGNFRGLQAAGALNVAGSTSGVQVSVLNVGGDVNGAQVGVVNVAGDVNGLQLGVVNVANSVRGVPFGLVSIVRDGQLHVDLWASDTHPVNLGVRFGSKTFYTFFTEGAEVGFDRFRGYSAMGFGISFPAGTVGVDVDLSGGAVHENFHSEGLQLLNKLRVGVSHRLVGRLAIVGGLAVNNWISRSHEVPAFVRLPSVDVSTERTQVRFWPGAFVGLRL
jgi:hypothetical protein